LRISAFAENPNNPHAHILLTLRALTSAGFGAQGAALERKVRAARVAMRLGGAGQRAFGGGPGMRHASIIARWRRNKSN